MRTLCRRRRLVGVGLGQDPGGDLDGDAADVVAQLDLAGVQPGPELEVDVAGLLT
jgi:hypothetical protein